MARSPTFVHERADWPELTWDAEALAAALANLRHRQGRWHGRMEALGFEVRAEASFHVLTADALKTSAIEGEHLNPDQVRSSLARRLGLPTAGLPRPSRDVDGLVEMLLDATQRYAEPLTKQRLFSWHAALFPTGRSGLRKLRIGAWRTQASGPMQVVSGPIGRERVHFVAPEARRVEAEMRRFLEWFERPSSDDPVLRAGLAHLWFVTIHPFEDGNGRIGRAIADLALARAERSPERFYSLSAQFDAERKDYYRELEAAQRGDVDATRWLAWFLGCLGRAIDGAESTLAAVVRKAHVWRRIEREPLSERQRKVLGRLLDGFEGKLTTSKYAKLAKCSQDSALRDVRELLERGLLARNEGGGRSVSYRFVDFGDDG